MCITRSDSHRPSLERFRFWPLPPCCSDAYGTCMPAWMFLRTGRVIVQRSTRVLRAFTKSDVCSECFGENAEFAEEKSFHPSELSVTLLFVEVIRVWTLLMALKDGCDSFLAQARSRCFVNSKSVGKALIHPYGLSRMFPVCTSPVCCVLRLF